MEHLLAAEGKKLPCEVCGPLSSSLDLLEVGAQRVFRPQAREDQVRVAEDHGEHVVEVVCHAAREPPDGLHLLRLTKLVLQALSLGEVQRNGDVLRPVESRHAHQDGNAGAILAEALRLAGPREAVGFKLFANGDLDMAPLGRHHLVPIDMPGFEVVARVADHREEGVVCLDNPAGGVGYGGPKDASL